MTKFLVGHVGDERDLPGALDRDLQLSLVHRARAGNPPRQNLAPLGHKGRQELDVLVVDVVDLVRAELADLAAPEHRPPLPLLLLFIFLVAAAAAATRPPLSEWHGYASIPSKRSSSRSSVSMDRPSPGCRCGGKPRFT